MDVTEAKKEVCKDMKWMRPIMVLNKILGTKTIEKTWQIGRVKITFEWRSSKNLMGRFGGGWNWHIGAEWGSTTIIFFLLICMLIIKIKPKETP